MKIAYLLHNPGIASRTPDGWLSIVISPRTNGSYSEADLEALADAEVLVVGMEPVTAVVLSRARGLKLIQRLGVGCDNIDVDAATRYRIPVCNMPDFNATTVAEHTIMLILALLRRLFESTLLMKGGRWPIESVVAQGIFDLRGKTLGIVGLGAIGREVARRVKPFDVKTWYFDKVRAGEGAEDELGVSFALLDDLLGQSDIVTLHLPLTPDTTQLIGRAELWKMKRTAIIINTARGAIVDELALADALAEGVIAGAGLDVFGDEPLDPKHPLRRCANVLLTPHIAGQTREAMERMVAAMLDNIYRVDRGEEPRNRVNPTAWKTEAKSTQRSV